jgi:Domain of unknown function (DUF4249)
MRITILILILIIGLLTSCYKVYDPEINTGKKVLVVNGMITNKAVTYNILLTYAESFNSGGTGLPVSAANVYITDDLDNSYTFHERKIGNYISDSLQFTGHPGRTYWLHVVTPDGEEYKSDPQRLFPEASPDSVYAEFDNKVILERTTGLKVNTHGANMLTDIRNQTDTLPRFRFTSDLVTQYFYLICPVGGTCISFYCWKTDNANPNLNLTGGKYSEGSASIRNYAVCFLDDNLYCYALSYGLRYSEENSSEIIVSGKDYKSFMVNHRILYLKQYTLNNEGYLYYKSLDDQMQSEGKLFDPIAVQLNGNIKCITDPEKKAIGFFEASSVSYSAYMVDFRNLTNFQPSTIKIPYILPPGPNGCRVNSAPLFWIFI